ncbi:MAG: alpha/beta fold hydrolase [Flavobacteriaceae bacterium]
MSQTKVPVYLMPGMAANSSIFKNIQLPDDRFETHRLEWFVPDRGMTLSEYAQVMCANIKHENPVLVGVSFGGILVQEIARHVQARKVIIISSVKSKRELPKRLIFAKYTKIHKLLPTGLVNNVELLAKYAFGEIVTRRLELYEQYLSIRDKYYLDWAIDQMVHWNQVEYDPDVIHIHGDRDAVFPIQHIKNCIRIEKGSHIMILNRSNWFNQRLPTIILEEGSSI